MHSSFVCRVFYHCLIEYDLVTESTKLIMIIFDKWNMTKHTIFKKSIRLFIDFIDFSRYFCLKLLLWLYPVRSPKEREDEYLQDLLDTPVIQEEEHKTPSFSIDLQLEDVPKVCKYIQILSFTYKKIWTYSYLSVSCHCLSR